MRNTILTLSFTILVVFLCHTVEAAPPEVKVFQMTMKQYVASATSNVDEMEYAFAYLEALNIEAIKQSCALDFRFRGSTSIQAQVKEARAATKAFVEKMGTLTESVCWYDFETHEQFEGTAYGFKLLRFQAQMLWREIIFYVTVRKSNNSFDFYGMHKPDLNNKIGGMSPDEIMTAVRIKRELSKLQDKSVNNLDSMAAADIDSSFVEVFNILKMAIISNDANAVASHVQFPIANSAYVVEPDNYSEPLTREKFIRGFNNLFSDHARLDMAKQSLKDVGVYDGYYCIWFELCDKGEFDAPKVCMKIEQDEGHWKIVSFAIAG